MTTRPCFCGATEGVVVFMNGPACADHTPAKLAGHPEPPVVPYERTLYGMIAAAGQEVRRAFPVSPGTYYLVFDNTPTAGQVAPPVTAFDDRAAVVSYLIQIGDAS